MPITQLLTQGTEQFGSLYWLIVQAVVATPNPKKTGYFLSTLSNSQGHMAGTSAYRSKWG